ncbi:SHOCT domain-containing protein [Natronorarus salvus]|uniref:SHOCT domain-containing protein n=1 Tax=Natronorarus salvus TaxID=3117733 RepID=UPI002F26DBCF
MASERLERLIGRETVGGWRLEAIDGERAVLKRPNYGSKLGHIVVFLLTVWFSLGIGNLLYAAYRYVNDSEYKVIDARDPVTDEEALTHLRRRYARGEIEDEEFDRRIWRLRGTESLEATGAGERRQGGRTRDRRFERSFERQ